MVFLKIAGTIHNHLSKVCKFLSSMWVDCIRRMPGILMFNLAIAVVVSAFQFLIYHNGSISVCLAGKLCLVQKILRLYLMTIMQTLCVNSFALAFLLECTDNCYMPIDTVFGYIWTLPSSSLCLLYACTCTLNKNSWCYHYQIAKKRMSAF